MFVNFSNHPSANWSVKQKQIAVQWGELMDVPFPAVPGDADEKFIEESAMNSVKEILSYHPDVVMCQGEFTLAYAVISLLKAQGVRVVAACSERVVEEHMAEGKQEKIATFEFVRFREYK